MAAETLLSEALHAANRTALVPAARPRRLRLNPHLRAMVRETQLAPDDLIYPLFVTHGRGVKNEISSMPGVYQWSPDQLGRQVEDLACLGIPAVLLFGLPAGKDAVGRENFADDGIVQQATRAIKAAVPEMVVVTDVCLCEYTDHGHCGLLNQGNGTRPRPNLPEGYVLNDETLAVLAQVEAGLAGQAIGRTRFSLVHCAQLRTRFPRLPRP